MSLEACRWAWSQDVGPTQKLILLALADHAREEGRCWPAQMRLAEMTGLSDRQVRNVLRALVAARLVAVKHRGDGHGGRASNIYTIAGYRNTVSDNVWELPEIEGGVNGNSEGGCRKPASVNAETVTGNLRQGYRKSDGGLPEIGEGVNGTRVPMNRKEPIKNRKRNRNKSARALTPDALVESLPGLSDSVAADYLAHRKTLRAPLTRSAWNTIAAEVRKSGAAPDVALGEAMAAGWRGFRADWFHNRSRSNGGNDNGAHASLSARNREAARRFVERMQQEARA